MSGTGAVSKLRTGNFCKKLKKTEEKGGIKVKMIEIYVNDGKIILKERTKRAGYNVEK